MNGIFLMEVEEGYEACRDAVIGDKTSGFKEV